MLARLLFCFALVPAAIGSLYDLEADDLESGLPVPLSYYKGKVVLIVNLASECGYTDSSYSHLKQLHARYAGRGLSILGFPCNDFGAQEPGDSAAIFAFARTRKRAEFDLFKKVTVNGPSAHPLYKWLLGDSGGSDCADAEAACASWAQSGECGNNPAFMSDKCRRSCGVCEAPSGLQPPIGWNFEYFLVTRSGRLHKRWPTGTDLTGELLSLSVPPSSDAPASPLRGCAHVLAGATHTREIETLLAEKEEL